MVRNNQNKIIIIKSNLLGTTLLFFLNINNGVYSWIYLISGCILLPCFTDF